MSGGLTNSSHNCLHRYKVKNFSAKQQELQLALSVEGLLHELL